MRVSSQLLEGLALGAIAVAIAVRGQAMISRLHAYEPAAVVLFGLAILAACISIRRTLLEPKSEHARLVLTQSIAYLTALVLALLAVVAPARWSAGSAIAMAEVSIVFDLFSRMTSHK